jgi:hypothetical protein
MWTTKLQYKHQVSDRCHCREGYVQVSGREFYAKNAATSTETIGAWVGPPLIYLFVIF